MKRTLLLTALTVMVSGCESSLPPTLHEKLEGKDANESRKTLFRDCLSEAEWQRHHNIPGSAGSVYRINRATELRSDLYPLKNLCREMDALADSAVNKPDVGDLGRQCARYVSEWRSVPDEHYHLHADRMDHVCKHMIRAAP